jgi:citrate lyase beta subunit
MLFVSGEKTERFAKAIAAGADLVCIDLEDAVHPDRKAAAREAVLGWLAFAEAAPPAAGLALRINGVRTPDGQRDLQALNKAGIRLDWLLLPKVEDPADARTALQATDGRFPLVALLETPRAIENALAIADTGGMGALMLGGADLSAELGATFGWDGLLYARGRLVNAAKAAGLQAWDVPHIDLADSAGLAEVTRRVLALGFDCKTAIHPQQVATIHAAFAPAPADLDWAQALLAALPAGDATGAFLFRGRMVDAPVLRKARRIVELAALTN